MSKIKLRELKIKVCRGLLDVKFKQIDIDTEERARDSEMIDGDYTDITETDQMIEQSDELELPEMTKKSTRT